MDKILGPEGKDEKALAARRASILRAQDDGYMDANVGQEWPCDEDESLEEHKAER
jgi:hypothetical protein